MSCSRRLIDYIGNVYRLWVEVTPEGHRYPLEALVYDEWVQVQCWDDPGYVASQLVKHGKAVDYAEALDLLR